MARRARTAVPRMQQARNMSGGEHAEHENAMNLMKKATMGGACIIGALTVINVGIHMSHDHHGPPPAYPYLQIYNKPFPWKENKCNLFDLDCKAKQRAAMRG